MRKVSLLLGLGVTCGIIPLYACYSDNDVRKELIRCARQIDRGRCGDFAKTQLRVMEDLSRCAEPDLKMIENAILILSAGNTFPKFNANLEVLNVAYDTFDGLPGFHAKLVNYLCHLDQESVTENFWREMALAFAIEFAEGDEAVLGFDHQIGDGKTSTVFSLITSKRLLWWQHNKLHPAADKYGSTRVAAMKQYFGEQKNLVDFYNKENPFPVRYSVKSACPIYRSWRMWFEEQKIDAQVE